MEILIILTIGLVGVIILKSLDDLKKVVRQLQNDIVKIEQNKKG